MDVFGAEFSARSGAARRHVVARAPGRVRARGPGPAPAVLALYARDAAGELDWAQVGAAMRRRRAALARGGPAAEPGPTPPGSAGPGVP